MITPKEVGRIILEQSKRAHVGHIGSALSIADIVAVLYGSVLQITDPDDPERDRFTAAMSNYWTGNFPNAVIQVRNRLS